MHDMRAPPPLKTCLLCPGLNKKEVVRLWFFLSNNPAMIYVKYLANTINSWRYMPSQLAAPGRLRFRDYL